MALVVCRLKPNTGYTFRISVKPLPEYAPDLKTPNGYRSEWRSVSDTTWEDGKDILTFCEFTSFFNIDDSDGDSVISTCLWPALHKS